MLKIPCEAARFPDENIGGKSANLPYLMGQPSLLNGTLQAIFLYWV